MERLSDDALVPLLAQLTLEEKVRLLTGRDSWSLHAMPKIGLRSIVMSDGPVGVRGDVWDERSPSVNFPSPTSLASSWDRSLVRSVGRALGLEARRKQVDVLLAPTINLHRTPYGGRSFEAFSEDPVLTGELASEYVAGVQEHGVAATPKHYIANESETERFTVDVRVDERALRELYLLAFELPVVRAGAWLVMSSYNSINGATASENDLLRNPLKEEWLFDGVVVSDWTAVRSLESARHAQDLAMPGPSSPWSEGLAAAVREGAVPEEVIDDKVLRILRLAARVGALEGYVRPEPALDEPHDPRRVAFESAVEGMVLLDNDGILPLVGAPTFALIGEGASVARTQGGGSATVIPESVVSPLRGLAGRFGEDAVSWARGAVVDRRPAPLQLSEFESETGEPGMVVTYRDADGLVIGEEHRAASTFVSFEGESLLTRSAVVEATFRYKGVLGGLTPLAIIGLSDYDVEVDGVMVASGSNRLQPGDDFATAVLTPPFSVVALPLQAGGSVVTVRFRPVEGGVPDAAAFGIGAPAPDVDGDALIAEAASLAAEREVAIVVVSTSPEVESEGFDRRSLALPGRQDELVRAVAAANPRTIVVVNSGAPVSLPWRQDVSAVLAVWFPGQEFGDALAAVVSGDSEPGGRLPVTWPDAEDDIPVRVVTPHRGVLDYAEGINIGYRAWLLADSRPAYPFGFGLGYTTWEVERLALSATEMNPDGRIGLSVTVRNTGLRRGKAVLQIYLERVGDSAVARPRRWLGGFITARADAAGVVEVSALVDSRMLAHWDGAWIVESGEYRLSVGFDVTRLVASSIIRVS